MDLSVHEKRRNSVSIKRLLTLFVLLSLLLPTFSGAAQKDGGDLTGAVSWLKDQQQEDGGFSNGFAPESDIGATADAVLALVIAGEDPALVKMKEKSPIDFLEERIEAGDVQGAGAAAKVILALNAVGIDPRSFGGVNLVSAVLDDFDAGLGLFGMGPFDSGLALAALVAIGETFPEGAVDGLLASRLEDGSFSFNVDESLVTGDSNTTAIVVQSLIAAGAEDAIGPSLDYFRATQNEDGGWTYQKPSEFGEETDANSTALVIQVLDAAGENLEDWGDPIATLESLQLESGAFGFSATFPDANILATIQAIPTLAGGTYVDPVASTVSQGTPMTVVVVSVSVLLLLIVAGAFVAARLRARV
jgi:hypothetical protein